MATLIERTTTPVHPYAGFDKQYINGAWRTGRRGQALKDINPYTGETLVEIAIAVQNDLEDAYQAAARAQPAWAAMLPAQRVGVMRRVAGIPLLPVLVLVPSSERGASGEPCVFAYFAPWREKILPESGRLLC